MKIISVGFMSTSVDRMRFRSSIKAMVNFFQTDKARDQYHHSEETSRVREKAPIENISGCCLPSFLRMLSRCLLDDSFSSS
jgi:hypothetical protein